MDIELVSAIEWVKFGKYKSLRFTGRDALCFGSECYLAFYNVNTDTAAIYRANGKDFGDGIACYAGHRTLPLFAIAERCINPRILIVAYPSFKRIVELEGGTEYGYLRLELSDTEYLVSLSDLPDFIITIWCWKTAEKLTTVPSGLSAESMMRVSYGYPFSIIINDKKTSTLHIWEVNIAYKKCLLSSNTVQYKKKDTGLPILCLLFSADNIPLVVNTAGDMYSANVDTHAFDLQFKWPYEQEDTRYSKPYAIWFKGGIALSGPTGEILHLKRIGVDWSITWEVTPVHRAIRMVAFSMKDMLIIWSESGEIQSVNPQQNSVTRIRRYDTDIKFTCILNPLGDYVLTINEYEHLKVWDKSTGEHMSEINMRVQVLTMLPNPHYPYVAFGRKDGVLVLISFFVPTKLIIMFCQRLGQFGIDKIKFSKSGHILVAANAENGQLFIVTTNPEETISVVKHIDLEQQIANYLVTEQEKEIRIVNLLVTTEKYIAGDRLELHTMNSEYQNHKKFSTRQPRLYSTVHPFFGKNCEDMFLAIPFLSKYIHIMRLRKGDNYAKIVNVVASGHQLRYFNLHSNLNCIITFGADGLATLHDVDLSSMYFKVMLHHRTKGGTKQALADPSMDYIFSLGTNNNLACTKLPKFTHHIKNELHLRMEMTSDKYKQIFHARNFNATLESVELETCQTWLEIQNDIKVAREALECARPRQAILNEFRSLRKKLVNMLEKNFKAPEEETLEIQKFNLDVEHRSNLIRESVDKCERTKLYLEATISAQNKVSDWIKDRCWKPIEVHCKKMRALFANFDVESYSLLPLDKNRENRMKLIKDRRTLEQMLSQEDMFFPWKKYTSDELKDLIASRPTIKITDEASRIREVLEEDEFASQALAKAQEMAQAQLPDNPKQSVSTDTNLALLIKSIEEQLKAEMMEKLEETRLIYFGTTAHHFLDVDDTMQYHQYSVRTFRQTKQENVICRHINEKLRVHFNKTFEDIMAIKQREMALVLERNARFRHILSELKNNEIQIEDPEWKQDEIPEKILTVAKEEVGILPYVSPSEQAILDAKAAEEERIRLLLLADDFKERALIVMMDGVLEIRWEDEIKKDVPLPECMKKKKPEDFNEEDLRTIKEYEEKVLFILSERERYRKMLEAEYAKLTGTYRDSIRRFNLRVSELFLLKLRVEAAIFQENVKTARNRMNTYNRLVIMKKEENALNIIKDNEASIDVILKEIAVINEAVADCRMTLDATLNRDRMFEKTFKKEFQEYSAVIQEQLYKYFRRHPKVQIKCSSAPLLHEIAHCILTKERTDFLAQDVLDYLKAMDHIDNFSGTPSTIDEHMFTALCKLRRQKIETEFKIRAHTVELQGAEATLAVYNRMLTYKQDLNTKFLARLQVIRDQRREIQRNITCQIVMKRGFVEVPLSGVLEDFDATLAINRYDIEQINKLITSQGSHKLKAMRDAMNFRRGILAKEWHHKKMVMEIEDYETQIKIIDGFKVLKDTIEFLRRKSQNVSVDKGMLPIDQEIDIIRESYEKLIIEQMHLAEEYEGKIQMQLRSNRMLDTKIIDMNVDVCESELRRDLEFESKEEQLIKTRMSTLIKRSRLLQKIQQQHNEMLVLQTELELLRLKTYPTLKFRTLP